MTADEKRNKVAAKYAEIIGRNYYSQNLRNYCYTPYKDGKYYSDCSSSICFAYKEAGCGFGILNTAGIYQSTKLTTVDIPVAGGLVSDLSKLRVGDMLEFAGNDSSRPKRIGHVEMVYSINGTKATICGHGSGRPSYKDMAAYCKSRYESYASGGWRKGLVCVRRFIQDDALKNGWKQENGNWKFYLGNSGECVTSAWYLCDDGNWYWFDANGNMLHDTWYLYKGEWYYLGSSGAMSKGLISVDGKYYAMDSDGSMITEPVILTPDKNGALKYSGLAED